MRPRVVLCLLIGAVFTACGARTEADASDPVPAVPDEFRVTYRVQSSQFRDTIPISAERVWELLPDAYRVLGFPGAVVRDGDEIAFSTPHLQIQGSLYPGERTSDYIDCGQASIEGERADAWQVTFVLITRVLPVGDNASAIFTTVDGNAVSRSTRAGAACRGTGKLERDLVSALRQLQRRRSDAML